MPSSLNTLLSSVYSTGKSAGKGLLNFTGLRRPNPALTEAALKQISLIPGEAASLSDQDCSLQNVVALADIGLHLEDKTSIPSPSSSKKNPFRALQRWRSSRSIVKEKKKEERLRRKDLRRQTTQSIKAFAIRHKDIIKESGYRIALATFRLYFKEKYQNLKPISRLAAHTALSEVKTAKHLLFASYAGVALSIFKLYANYKSPIAMIPYALFVYLSFKYAPQIADKIEDIACHLGCEKIKQKRMASQNAENPKNRRLMDVVQEKFEGLSKITRLVSKGKKILNSETALAIVFIAALIFPLAGAIHHYYNKISSYSGEQFRKELRENGEHEYGSQGSRSVSSSNDS